MSKCTECEGNGKIPGEIGFCADCMGTGATIEEVTPHTDPTVMELISKVSVLEFQVTQSQTLIGELFQRLNRLEEVMDTIIFEPVTPPPIPGEEKKSCMPSNYYVPTEKSVAEQAEPQSIHGEVDSVQTPNFNSLPYPSERQLKERKIDDLQ